jgi:hypothetical protein
MTELVRPKRSFVDWFKEYDENRLNKDLSRILLFGGLCLLDDTKLSLKEKRQIRKLILSKIDDRIGGRQHRWDGRNWRWFWNLHHKVRKKFPKDVRY